MAIVFEQKKVNKTWQGSDELAVLVDEPLVEVPVRLVLGVLLQPLPERPAHTRSPLGHH